MRITIVAVIFCIALISILAVDGCSKKKPTETATQPSDTANHPPAVPSVPSPADNAAGQNPSVLCLQWGCYDQDSRDTLSYEVRMGAGTFTDSVSGVATETVMLTNLDSNTNYIWQVTAKDNHNARSQGPVWHFKTQ